MSGKLSNNPGDSVAEIVRVSRSGDSLIVRDGVSYTVFSVDGTQQGEPTSLTTLLSTGSFRKPLKSELAKFSDALQLASGGVVASAEATARTFRVPPTVRRAIADALESYSSVIAEEDRQIAVRLATHTSVSKADIEWMYRHFENVEKANSLHGGKRGQAWAAKMLNQAEEAEPVLASAFDYDDDLVYFAGGDDPDSTQVDTLYAVEYDEEGDDLGEDSLYEWQNGTLSYVGPADDLDRPQLIELDAESAQALADWLDGGTSDGSPFELQDIDPEERNLFELAYAELDYEGLDRLATVLADATGYAPAERSHNAGRQPRGPGGTFGGPPAPVGQTLSPGAFAKAHFQVDPAVVENLQQRIDEYFASVTPVTAAAEDDAAADVKQVIAAKAESTEGGAAESTTSEPGSAEPLYLAIVDTTDKTAVLDVVAVAPDENGEPAAWLRVDGAWTFSPEKLEDLRGVTPPVTVELADEAQLKDVLAQVDEHDGNFAEDGEAIAASAFELAAETKAGRERAAKRGYALPDGSFPIANEADLKKAIKAYGRAKDKAAAQRHIKKRARALNRADLIPEDWKSASLFDNATSPLVGEFGELIAAGVPGISDTPSDRAAVSRLKQYWAFGKGTAKWRPGTPGDWTRLRRLLTKYVGPNVAAGLATNIYQLRFGMSNAKHDKLTGER
jgi:hypothetical protein